MAGDVVSEVRPDLEYVVMAVYKSRVTPQHQQWGIDLAASISTIVFQIDRSGGTVVLTGAADCFRVAEAAAVLIQSIARERII